MSHLIGALGHGDAWSNRLAPPVAQENPNEGKIYIPGVGWVTPEQAANLFPDEGGGFAPPSFSSTESGLRLQAQLDAASSAAQFNYQKQLELMQQQFQAKQELLKRQAEEKLRLEQLKQERQRLFAEMVGNDPVRAVLFGLGLGGSFIPGAEKFAGLPRLSGARELDLDTEKALTKLGAGIPGQVVGVGQNRNDPHVGVYGLNSPEQLARQFMQGSGVDQTLLTSAFGVGGTGTGFTGLNTQELVRRIGQVTPKGVLP